MIAILTLEQFKKENKTPLASYQAANVAAAQKLSEELNALNGKYKTEVRIRSSFNLEDKYYYYASAEVVAVIPGNIFISIRTYRKGNKTYYTAFPIQLWEIDRDFFNNADYTAESEKRPMNNVSVMTGKKLDAMIEREIEILNVITESVTNAEHIREIYIMNLQNLFGAECVKLKYNSKMEGYVKKDGFILKFSIYKNGYVSERVEIDTDFQNIETFAKLINTNS